MERKYIKITEYCEHEEIETSFVLELYQEGILPIEKRDDDDYLSDDVLPDLEMFRRWHYDLGINLEGIDAMRHMVQRLKDMQRELNQLRQLRHLP